MIAEFVKLFFKEENVEKARKLFFSDETIASVDSEHLVRLYKSKAGTVNFEFFVNRTEGARMIEYIQPIGFYNFSNHRVIDTHFTLLREFEEVFNAINNEIAYSLNTDYKPLSINENLIIGAASMTSRLKATLQKDTLFNSNGFEYQLLWTYDKEYMQSFLSDKEIIKFGIDSPITTYLSQEHNGRDAIVPMLEFQEIYNDLINKELLTAYR